VSDRHFESLEIRTDHRRAAPGSRVEGSKPSPPPSTS